MFGASDKDLPSHEIDKTLNYFLIILSVIVALGIIMVYSSSYIYAKETFGTSTYFFKRQLAFVFMGSVFAFLVGHTKIDFWLKYSFYINSMASLLLVLTFFPGIGLTVKGASRWLSVGGMNVQPGEIIKYTVMLASLSYFEKFYDYSNSDKVLFGSLLFFPLAVLIQQPDYGTFLICFVVIVFVCFMSSFSRKHFFYLTSIGAILGSVVLFMESYRVKRIFTFLDPWENPQTSGFQIIQSYLAFANGGIFGEGLGNSNEKLFYLPEAHNDFIFSVVGEELGYLGVLFVVLLFLIFIYLGFKLALKINSKFSQVLTISIVFLIGIQAFLNMGVVLGLLPTKGLNLPFISYGGSSVVSNFFAIGLIISAFRQERRSLNNIGRL